MSTEYVERSTTIINRIEGLELVPYAMRLLANGEPVALEELAAAPVPDRRPHRVRVVRQRRADLLSRARPPGRRRVDLRIDRRANPD